MTKKLQPFTGLVHLGRQPASSIPTLTDTPGSGAHRADPGMEAEGPYDYEGMCCACGRNSCATNRRNLCRSCATDPDSQTAPPHPE